MAYVKASVLQWIQPDLQAYWLKDFRGRLRIFYDPRFDEEVLQMYDIERPDLPPAEVSSRELEPLFYAENFQAIVNICRERFKAFLKPSKRRFDWPYKYPWQVRREILLRKFEALK